MISCSRPRGQRPHWRHWCRGHALYLAIAPSTLLLIPLLSPGCAASRPDPGAEALVSDAAGVPTAIEFHTEAGPLDETLIDLSGATGTHLTSADAVRLAVTTDPQLQAALARVRGAMADADQARLLPNPILSVVFRFGDGGSPQIEASLAQEFIQVLQQRNRASAADNRMRRAAVDAVTTALDSIQQVQERYAEAQSLDQLVPILQERLVLIGKLFEVARNRLNAGEGTRPDVTSLDTQRVELEVEIADAVLRQRAARLQLARLIGVPSSEASWTLEPPPSTTPQDLAPEHTWIAAGLAHRPEVHAGVWELAALGDDAALARLFPFEGASVGVDAQRDQEWTVGPSISSPIPVFDTGQAKQAKVTAQMIEARHNLTLAKRRVVEEVRVAYQRLVGTRHNLQRVRGELLPLQNRRREEAEALFRAGQSDVTPLFLAEQDLRTTQSRICELEQQAATALAQLQRAVGGPGVAAGIGTAPAHPQPGTNHGPASESLTSPVQ